MIITVVENNMGKEGRILLNNLCHRVENTLDVPIMSVATVYLYLQKKKGQYVTILIVLRMNID